MVDAIREQGLEPIPVSITSGKRVRRANGMVYVPKREFLRGLVTAFENERLKIAKGLPLAEAFIGELQAFRLRLTIRGHDTYAARSGEHDDLVLVVALAVWRCQSLSPPSAPDVGDKVAQWLRPRADIRSDPV